MSSAPERVQDEAKQLAKRIALLSGETEDQAVVVSLRERLERLENRKKRRSEFESLRSRWQSLPSVDGSFTEDSMYDEQGLPK